MRLLYHSKQLAQHFLTKCTSANRWQWLKPLVLLWALGGGPALAQAPAWELALSGHNNQPTSGEAYAQATAVDASGNVVVTGYFFGQATFGNVLLVSAGNADAFVAKWNTSTSTWAWATQGGGTGNDAGMGVAVQGTSVYVTGYFTSGTGTATPTLAGTTLAGAGGMDMFLAEYSDQGNSFTNVGAISAGGTGADAGRAVAMGSSGALYVTGYFTSGFNTRVAGVALPGVGNTDMFVAKYTDQGSVFANGWATSGGSNGADYGNGVAVSGSSVYVTGSFASGSSAGIAGVGLFGAGNTDMFVAKYTDQGSSFANGWALGEGGSGADYGNAVAANGNGIFVSGGFGSGSNATIATTALAGAGGTDMFLAKYTDQGSSGSGSRSVSGGGTGTDYGSGLALSSNSVYVTGTFTGGATTSIAGTALTVVAGLDVFVARYTDSSSGFGADWASSGGGGGNEQGRAVAVAGSSVYAFSTTESVASSFGSGIPALVPPFDAVLSQLSASNGSWQQNAWPLLGSTSQVTGTTTDASGNVFVTGNFSGSLAFGRTHLVATNSTSVFVAKWDAAAGAWAWATSSSGGVSYTSITASGIAVSGNNVYVTGTCTYGGNSAMAGVVLAGAGNKDMFVAKFIDQGTTYANGWATTGGSVRDDLGTGVAASGNSVYVTGNFLSGFSARFAGATLAGAGGTDAFLAKYTDNGTTVSNGWAVSGGGTGDDYGTAIAVSGSSVYLTGYFLSGATARFANTVLAGAGNYDAFLAKYTDNGTTVSNGWAVSGGGTNADIGSAVAVSGSNVYLTGMAASATSSFAGVNMTAAGRTFIAKYPDLGSTVGTGWVTSGGGASSGGTGIAVSGTGVFVTGYFNGGFNSTFVGTQLPSTNSLDVFLVKYTDNGSTFSNGWVAIGGGVNEDRSAGIALSGRRVYVAGYVAPLATFGPFTLSKPYSPGLTGGVSINFLAGLTDGAPAPTLTSISPASGALGSVITVNGLNLTGATTITFTGVANNTVTSGFTVNAAGTQITGIVVPSWAVSGNLTVTTPAGTSNTLPFTVTTPPVPLAVTSLTPANLAAGVSRSTSVRAQFNQDVTSGSAAALRVHSLQTGLRSQTTPPVVSGNSITYTPPAARPFQPGELVTIGVTTTAAGRSGNLVQGKVQQFTTAVGGTGRGNFQYLMSLNGGNEGMDLAVGDMDGDGSVDLVGLDNDFSIVGGNGKATIFYNDGNGSGRLGQRPRMTFPIDPFPQAVALADVNNDGYPDILATTLKALGPLAPGAVDILPSYGMGFHTGLTLANSRPTGSSPIDIAVGDINADGLLDYVTANEDGNSVTFSNFSTIQFPPGYQPQCVELRDMDGDGDLDMIVGKATGGLQVWLNNAQGTFTLGSTYSPPNGLKSMAVSDVDGDGDQDVVTASYNSPGGFLNVSLNDGTGILTRGQNLPIGSFATCVVLGDVDADGDLDLLTTESSNHNIYLRLNNGSGQFGTSTVIAYGQGFVGYTKVALGDADNDGDLDVFAMENVGMLSVFLNAPAAPVVTAFTPGSGPVGTTVTLTGTNLGGATSVNFGGVPQTVITNNTGTSLTVTVPAGAITGTLTLTTPGGTIALGTFTVVPTLTSINPNNGARGSTVTLTGTTLTGTTTITFAGTSNRTVSSGFTVASATSITGVVVPSGAITGLVTVTTTAGTSNGVLFTVTGPQLDLTQNGTAYPSGGLAYNFGNQPVATTSAPISFTLANAGNAPLTLTGVTTTGNFSLSGTVPTTVAAGGTATVSVLFAPTTGGSQVGTLRVVSALGTYVVNLTGTGTYLMPTLGSTSPGSGAVGSTIVISGTNLTGTTSVTINGVNVTSFVVNASGTTLTLVVPVGATSGNIVVTTPGGTATSASPLCVLYTPSATPASRCGTGNITLTASGAPTGGRYAWYTQAMGGTAIAGATGASYIIVGLAATTIYYVAIETGTGAAACEGSRTAVTATINALPVAAITANGPLTFCVGGTVTLTAAGGTTYRWSTGATTASIVVSTGGSYTVTATNASGCSATSAATTVSVNPGAVANAGPAASFCAGGSAQLGVAPLAGTTYSWSPTAGLTSATAANPTVTLPNSTGTPITQTYTLTATTASGCTATSTVSVTVNPAPSASVAASGPISFCQGGSVTLTATAPAGSTYLWSNGATTPAITVGTAGNYSVTVNNGSGCSATSATTTVNVNAVPAQPAISLAASGGSVVLTSSTASGNQWYLGGMPIPGATGATYTVSSSAMNGTYTVVTTSASGCASPASAPVLVLGTAAPALAAQVQLYPNPTRGRFTVRAPGPARVRVLNALGQEVTHQSAAATTMTLDLTGLATGVYAVQVQVGSDVVVKRIVLE
jgi:hypothetical protein